MDRDALLLQEGLTDIEYVAEQVLITRQKMVECDRERNSNREALSALRRQARTSRSSVASQQKPKRALITEVGGASKLEDQDEASCTTCGDHDMTAPTWTMFRTADVFVRLPFHMTHTALEQEAEQLDRTSRVLQSTLKENTMSLSEKGGLSDRIPASLLEAFVNLKDNR